MTGERILITGGTGFVGAHCILQLLQAGYHVRTTLRSLSREADLRAMLAIGGMATDAPLSVVAADLNRDDGWAAAADGCAAILHVASPIPALAPRDENELIVPARDGTIRVLRTAREAGTRRVVLTSSFGSIAYGSPPIGRPFTEADWTDPNGKINAYVKSKTLAERAAWDFIASDGGALELAVINPGAIFGPVLGPDFSVSAGIVKRLMDRSMPGCPRLSYGIVDVRDVADLHLRAMTAPAACGERFIAIADDGDGMSIRDIALLLKARMGEAAARVPTRQLPDWLMRLIGRADASVAQIVPSLGKVKPGTSEKARRLLGWSPRSSQEAVLATAESLLRLGLLR